MSIYIDANIVHSYPLSNLNRDEFGSPKIAYVGGVERSRVSSACIKRGCRLTVEDVLGDKALRTRRVPAEVAAELTARGWSEEEATAAGQAVTLAAGVKGLSIAEETGTTSVMLYLPAAGITALADLVEANRDTVAAAAHKARADADAEGAKGKTAAKTKAPKLDKETAKRIKAVQEQVRAVLATRNASIAAFGRMLANTPEVTVDGAIAVAHAVTAHATEEQGDFFTAVDDVPGESGSAHMGHGAYTAGVFHRFATVNVTEQLRNLDGDQETAEELTRVFLREFAVHVPNAKKNSTAPFTPPALVYFTVRTDQPVSLAGAFEAPVTADQTSGWIAPSVTRLDQHTGATNSFYGTKHLLLAAHSGTAANLPTVTHLGRHIPLIEDLVNATVTAAFTQDNDQ
ncbi:type I-E CRISPR-associated protein Cas7/Cse4/CasC [Streptomyces xanthochromogenes]|uniref:Type I-E CRISPR-associated protein Cas7/Cse4/CasC n=1 Tax=Streptomyces xanthochromogenes TaxID=67384 RepID=A0ABQ2ZD85_9ACTN|nr:type I-E CRISPR-associated protein Cas7/Cse4/CasC [Streptomyces xanthochromogenes]GGY13215.1 type I-E CRISPR-associated protein Cas7/Cse4/CasC [Streptomyces xanthochromogenes]